MSVLAALLLAASAAPAAAEPGRWRADLTERLLEAPPREAPSALFERKLREREAGLLARLRASAPGRGGAGSPQDAAAVRGWREAAARGQAAALLDALNDAVQERCQLRRLEREAEALLKDPGNWDAELFAAAVTIGAGAAYLNGVRAAGRLGPVSARLQLRPAAALEDSLRRGTDAPGLARVELSLPAAGLVATARWGAARGSLRSESYGLEYRLAY